MKAAPDHVADVWNWACSNSSCILHGKSKALGPGNKLVTWTCTSCKTPMVDAKTVSR